MLINFGEATNACQYGIYSQGEAGLSPIVHINCVTDGYDMFRVCGDGKISSNYLSGTTSSLIETLPNGTIQRSTQTIPAAGIDLSLDTTNFDKNLDTTITDVQKLANAVDELELGGTQIQSDWSQADNTQVDYIKNKPNGTATVAKMFYFSGIVPTGSNKFTIYNTDLNLDSSIDLTQIEILCQFRIDENQIIRLS